jgi:hypothetical protein
VRPRQDLTLENLLLRHQLAVLTRPTRRRSHARLRLWDKLLWVLARQFCAGWREHLSFVTPETVVRWHRRGWRLFWRWTSRSPGGRPYLTPEIRDLIATMSCDNRLWGTERIRGELLKLGIVVSNRSIRRYRWRGPGRAPTQTWRTFLYNDAHHLWAADLLSVPMLTFKTLHVLVFIAHGRRELVHVNVTANPTAAWVSATHRGNALGPETAASAPRSGCRLRPRLRRGSHRSTRALEDVIPLYLAAHSTLTTLIPSGSCGSHPPTNSRQHSPLYLRTSGTVHY